MEIEYEIKFLDIDPDETRKSLRRMGANCTIPLRRMQRYVFAHPTKINAYIRIRQEWNKTTTSYKEHSDERTISCVEEIEVTVDSAEGLRQIYTKCWLKEKAIQETYRETRQYNNTTITIDRRPGLAPFLEIEWSNEISVIETIEALSLEKSNGVYGTVSNIYNKVLGIPLEIINNTPLITFENPPQPRKHNNNNSLGKL